MRADVKAILADPVKRRELMIEVIIATQAREGIETTRAQAERAYDSVTEGEGTMINEPEAARLRRERKLWPQILTEEQLQQQLDAVDADSSPISARMLREEDHRRRLERIR